MLEQSYSHMLAFVPYEKEAKVGLSLFLKGLWRNEMKKCLDLSYKNNMLGHLSRKEFLTSSASINLEATSSA